MNNKIYDNDNSDVIYLRLCNVKILLMVDAGINVEDDLLNKCMLFNIDVLKVSHHGSHKSQV